MLTLDDIAALEALHAKAGATAREDTALNTNASAMRAEGAMRRLEIAAVNALPGLLALARRGLEAPDAAALRPAFRHGREIGRDDAVQACGRFVAQAEEEAREAEAAGDADAAGDLREAAALADMCREFVARLGPVEEADEPEEYGGAAEVAP